MKKLIALATTTLPVAALQAQVFLNEFNGINKNIGDASTAGLVDSRTLSIPESEVLNVTVSLTIQGTSLSGAYNGDLYITLSHGGSKAVLMNRVGRTATESFGYSDNGLSSVTFSDDAANGDIHNYRLTLNGNPATELGGPLTGEWQPDGRDVNPGNSLDTSPRTASLSNFQGLDPSGKWTLFVADTSAGGTARLQSWSLSITAFTPIDNPVPEPAETAAVMAALLGGFAAWRARNRGAN